MLKGGKLLGLKWKIKKGWGDVDILDNKERISFFFFLLFLFFGSYNIVSYW